MQSPRAIDLGVAVVLDDLQAGTCSTRVRFHLEDAPFPYTVAGAVLNELPLIRVDSEGESRGWMVFGPLPADAVEVLLVVTRLQVPADESTPDVYVNPFIDPYAPF